MHRNIRNFEGTALNTNTYLFTMPNKTKLSAGINPLNIYILTFNVYIFYSFVNILSSNVLLYHIIDRRTAHYFRT